MRKAIAVVSTAILLAVGSVAVASHNFTDVDEGNIFHDDIAWMYDNGITFGYGDGTYGPKDFMTREQMAAFMHRLYNRIQQDIPELPDDLDVSVSLEEVCALFDTEPGSQACKDALRGDAGPQGPRGEKGDEGDRGKPGLANVESDGPYPGLGQLQEGSNSTKVWSADPDVLQTSWVMCPDGKVAIGGGFSPQHGEDDLGNDSKKGLEIVTSAPIGDAIPGDADGSILPTGWIVKGFNGTGAEQVVRPHVICADIAG